MTSAAYNRIVRLWLAAVAALIFAMVLVGGATRLTESGLSIVEWKPVTGAIPPLTEQHWKEAFEGYKTIPQYRELNRGMTLDEFKTIYYWEWSHRFLGRFIGAAYLVPFLFVLSPQLLLQGAPWAVALAAATATAGVWLVSIAVTGYFLRPLGAPWRAAFAASGLMALIPAGAFPGAIVTDVAGTLAGLALIGYEVALRRRR